MISTGIHTYKGGAAKSTVAIGIAAEKARSGKKVALVDGDFGVPALTIASRIDDFESGLGLADFYTGRVRLEEIVRKPNLTRLLKEFPDADLDGLERLFVIPPGDESHILRRHDIDYKERAEALLRQAESLGFDEVIIDCRGGSQIYSIEAMRTIDRPIVVGNNEEIEIEGMVKTLISYRDEALRGLFGNSPVRVSQFAEKIAYECARVKVGNVPDEELKEALTKALEENFRVSTSKVKEVLYRTLKQVYDKRNPNKELEEEQKNELKYRALRLLPSSPRQYLEFAERVARQEQDRGARTDYEGVLSVMRDFATNAAGVIVTRVKSEAMASTAFERVKQKANSEGLDVKSIGFFPESKDAKSMHYFLQKPFLNGADGDLDALLNNPATHRNLARVDLLKLKRQYDLAYGGQNE